MPTLREPGGRLIPLGLPSAAAVNQLGHVCGRDGPATNVFLYAKGRVTNLGFLPGHPPLVYNGQFFTQYFPTSLNDFDTVIGVLESNVPNTFSTGWVYTNGKMYDLAQSITPQSGFIVSNVETILDNGQILASGGLSFPDDLTRTVVLTPRLKNYIKP